MLHFFRFFILLINIDQETVLNWFGLSNSNNQNIYSQVTQVTENDYNLNLSGVSVKPSSALSLDTLKLIIEGLWEKVQDGLTLADIESILFFILFVRFIILAIKYNLKTSFYITCIGLVAGYLWYRHLIDLISMYRSVLLKLPFLHKFGVEAVQVQSFNRQISVNDFRLNDNIHWYNPGQLIYYAFLKGVISVDPESGLRTYIDPLSMIISNLRESDKVKVLPFYYTIYNTVLPKFFEICSKFWSQLSGVAGYAIITRIGKKYCPYLIRWHWTFLLIIGMIEQILVFFIYRVYYFQTFVLIPQLSDSSELYELSGSPQSPELAPMFETSEMAPMAPMAPMVPMVPMVPMAPTAPMDPIAPIAPMDPIAPMASIDPSLENVLDSNLLLQINVLDGIIAAVVLGHIGLIMFWLFHAIWGQYFYFPFFVENTELHIGARPKLSIYSGGNTPWQDSTGKEKILTKIDPPIISIFKGAWKLLIKRVRKLSRKLLRWRFLE